MVKLRRDDAQAGALLNGRKGVLALAFAYVTSSAGNLNLYA